MFNPEQVAAALNAAPDRVDDPDTPYDPNDEAAVDAFWENAEVRKCKLAGLLSRCDPCAPIPQAVTEWDNMPATGRETW